MAETPATETEPWPVRLLAEKLKAYIDRLGQVWIEGEITQWSVSNGTVYGKLKDLEADATVGFAIWSSVRSRVPANVQRGDRVIASVKANYWVRGGTLTMQVASMRHVGLGDLLEKLERLRAQLTSEGLFSPARKKPLPFLPTVIGLVTGKDSDAEKDVLRNAQLRWPGVRFRIAYAAVQGERTVPEVLAALETLEADPEVDVIIVARGGGDFQNLLGFSDERVVRAVAAMQTPVVSAIGHEADRPLLDDVADLRASTPTDAAKRVVPDVLEERSRVEQARTRIRTAITQRLGFETSGLAAMRSRPVLADPTWIVDRRAEEIARALARGRELSDRTLDLAHRKVAEAKGHLRALSPLRTLERGYAIVLTSGGAALRDVADAPSGTSLTVQLADGRLGATSTGPAH